MPARPLSYLALGLVVVTIALAGVYQTARLREELSQPLSIDTSSYVGSAVCRKCHHDNDDSWHRTYHRTMTQQATEASVLGDFSGAELTYMGVTARMERGPDGEFLMTFHASGGGVDARWRATVERTVGSHRYQQYLARDGDVYYRLPIAWDVEERRFIHMNGAFLTPDPDRLVPEQPIANKDYNRHVTRWNDNCIYCHNVAPNPGLQQGKEPHFESEVAELGVACEACHGPGSAHVADNRNPLRRYLLHLGDGRDPTIANPLRLSPARAADVCGRCHGQRVTRDISKVHATGDRFVPGQDLSDHSRPLFHNTTLNGKPGVFSARFWPDGTARLTAYEFQGLLQSRCATEGPMTCNDCHAMHGSDPAGQLQPDLKGNRMCTQCHDGLARPDALYSHTHHHTEGPGSKCVNCHMPRVVYGLVRMHRSHRIAVPKPGAPPAQAQPDACLLCHTDQNGAWAAQESNRLWPEPPSAKRFQGLRLNLKPATPDPAGRTRARSAIELLLAGDPIERATAADALGREAADATGAQVGPRVALLLDTLAQDAYPAVRQIAWRSVRALLARHAPATAPELAHFVATDEPAARKAVISNIAARLPQGFATLADPDRVTALRSQADAIQIEIGE
ncbi:MAG: multiheme c-type cytochrome [Myxococcales bacterium]|nr:multiheme c-type cytochrome [Myxococcales bacterium]